MIEKIKSAEDKKELKLIPKISVIIYSCLAIFIVVIPELLAKLGLSITGINIDNDIPKENIIWNKSPELIIARLTLFELREMAFKLKLIGYSSDTREILSKRLVKKLYRENNS